MLDDYRARARELGIYGGYAAKPLVDISQPVPVDAKPEVVRVGRFIPAFLRRSE